MPVNPFEAMQAAQAMQGQGGQMQAPPSPPMEEPQSAWSWDYQGPPTSAGQPGPDGAGVSGIPSFGDWMMQQGLPGGLGALVAGLVGGKDAASQFGEGWGKMATDNLLQQREAQFMHEQESIKRAEEAVQEWSAIGLKESEWKEAGITPDVRKHMVELSQKMQKAKADGKITPKEAKEINEYAWTYQNKIGDAKEKARRYQAKKETEGQLGARSQAEIGAIGPTAAAQRDAGLLTEVPGYGMMPPERAHRQDMMAQRQDAQSAQAMQRAIYTARSRSADQIMEELQAVKSQLAAASAMSEGDPFATQPLEQRIQELESALMVQQQLMQGAMAPPPGAQPAPPPPPNPSATPTGQLDLSQPPGLDTQEAQTILSLTQRR